MGTYITKYVAVAVLLFSGATIAIGAENNSAEDAKGTGCPKRSLMFAYGIRGGSWTDNNNDYYPDNEDIAPSLSIDYSSRGEGSLGWEAGIGYALHQEFFGTHETDMDVYEGSLGGRLTYLGFAGKRGGLLPYASAGLSGLILSGRSDSGAVGAYARGGLNYVFGGGFTMGIDLKALTSTSDDLDYYIQFALQLGWSF